MHPKDNRCPKEKKILYITKDDPRNVDDFGSDEIPQRINSNNLSPKVNLEQLNHSEILRENKSPVRYRRKGRSRRAIKKFNRRRNTCPNLNNNNNNNGMYG